MPASRVLFPYTGDSVGGSHVSSLLLAQGLRARGHDVTLGLHQAGGPLSDYLLQAGETWISLPEISKPPRMRAPWKQWLRRRRACARLDPFLRTAGFGIVHTHDMRNHQIWNAAVMRGAAKHIWHQRTPAPGKHMTDYAGRAAAVLTVSHFTKSSLTRALQPKARVIYNPFLEQEKASAAARDALCAELGVAPGTPVVGFVGNFSERKRPELFVGMAGRVGSTVSPVVFCTFGAPLEPLAASVRSRAEALALTDRLHVMGQRFPFGPYMAGLSVLVARARREALGRTLIEACFAGVPVAATDEGGNPEIIRNGETGWLMPADDADAFARTVTGVLADPDGVARVCTKAQAFARDTFSLELHLDWIEGVDAEVAGQEAGPAP
ncbi:MAG: glycosyltransferase family 4 protein [Pseudomonadota bacterium]